MTTLTSMCFTALLAAYIEQGFASPCKNDVCRMTKGDMFAIHCSTADHDRDHLTLYARLPQKQVLVEYDLFANYTVSKDYNKRLKISGTIHKITMTISDLQLSDSGLYIGEYTKYDHSKQQEVKEESCYIVLIVNDVDLMLSNGSLEKSTSKGLAMNEPVMLVLGLTAGTMLIVFLLVMWVLYPKVKAQCRKKTDTEVQAQELSSPVYEDMHRLQHGKMNFSRSLLKV